MLSHLNKAILAIACCAPEPESSDLPAPESRSGPLQKVPPAICLPALLARPSITRSPTGRCLVSISKMAEPNRQQSRGKLHSAYHSWEKELALLGRCRCRPTQRHPLHHYRELPLPRNRPYAYLHDVLTRLPSMTNWQVKHVTPEAWAKASRFSATATA
jgi:hypothetical protein